MIGHAADSLGNGARLTRHAAEVGVEPFAPFCGDSRFAIFGRENDMKME